MSEETKCTPVEHAEGITLASFRWNEIGVYLTITTFVITAGFVKLGFHKLKWLSDKIPESCLLIVLGVCVSLLMYLITGSNSDSVYNSCEVQFRLPMFSSELFFFILLPPIVLDSAYALHDRVFLDNFGTILNFAVIGTLFNVFAIGFSLYGTYSVGLMPNMKLNLTETLVFSSLISAVDPVAVLAIFQELGINNNLYFLVFGESLLNDGVTIVLYNTMEAFRRMDVITIGQYLLAILSFFIVSIGGIFIGLFFGILSAVITKCTHSVRVVEPLALLGLAYLSYLTSELFHFSGIISLIVCGLIQAHYGFYNVSQKSYICVKYFTKMASATSDTIIFLFLGFVLVNVKHQWNAAFVLWSLLFCLLYRFIAVFLLSALSNRFRTKYISFREQIIIGYGGLRGAVAFSLATTLHEEVPQRITFIFTTLVVVLFTVFVQGITIRPLVNCLNIQKQSKTKKNLVEEISESSMDHIMAGIEEVLGHHGDFYLMELVMHYNEKYFKKWFLHESSDAKLTRLFEKISLSEHYAHLYASVAMVDELRKPMMDYGPTGEVLVAPLSPAFEAEEVTFRTSLKSAVKKEDLKKARRWSLIKTDVDPIRRGSIKSVFTPVREAFSNAVSPSPDSLQGDREVLRSALRDHKYNQLHYTYNRNLVDEENQELSNHLSRRSMNARRISLLASARHRSRPQSSQPSQGLPGQLNSIENIERKSHASFRVLAKSLILLDRYQGRASLQEIDEKISELAEETSSNQSLNSVDSAKPGSSKEDTGDHFHDSGSTRRRIDPKSSNSDTTERVKKEDVQNIKPENDEDIALLEIVSHKGENK